MEMCSAEAGESVFFRKGAHISPPHLERDLCILIFFIPDAFVREVIRKLAAELQRLSQPAASNNGVTPALHGWRHLPRMVKIHCKTPGRILPKLTCRQRARKERPLYSHHHWGSASARCVPQAVRIG